MSRSATVWRRFQPCVPFLSLNRSFFFLLFDHLKGGLPERLMAAIRLGPAAAVVLSKMVGLCIHTRSVEEEDTLFFLLPF